MVIKSGSIRKRIPQTEPLLECFLRVKQGPSLDLLAAKKATLEDAIAELDDECAQITYNIQVGEASIGLLNTARRELATAKRQLREINRQINGRPIAREDAQRELEQILALPQVVDAWACTPELIAFTVRARLTLEGVTYDLGTWNIHFGDFESSKLAQGIGDRSYYRVRKVGRSHMNAFYNYDDGSFCFDNTGKSIDDYAAKHHFIHAVQTAISCLCSVNEEDIDYVHDKSNYPVVECGRNLS